MQTVVLGVQRVHWEMEVENGAAMLAHQLAPALQLFERSHHAASVACIIHRQRSFLPLCSCVFPCHLPCYLPFLPSLHHAPPQTPACMEVSTSGQPTRTV